MWLSKAFLFFDFFRGGLQIFSCERFLFVFQGGVYFVYLFGWFTTLADDDLLIVVIDHCGGYYFLRVHYPYDISPFVVDLFLFELMSDRVYHPIGQQSQVKMCHRSLIGFMVYRPKVKIGFQGAEGGLYFPDRIIDGPLRFFIFLVMGGTQ